MMAIVLQFKIKSYNIIYSLLIDVLERYLIYLDDMVYANLNDDCILYNNL